MLKPEWKEKWLRALRSGEYAQTRHTLKNNEGFCCLGVLCDITKEELNGGWENHTIGVVFVVGNEVHRTYAPTVALDLPVSLQNHLAGMNDGGKTFAEIADYIEKHLMEADDEPTET